MAGADAARAVAGLRELRRLAGGDNGAQGVAWTDAWIPAVMLFVKSLGGVRHTKDEDTPYADLELSVRALYELPRRTIAWAGERSA